MNWQHFQAFLWLRWRLRINQLKRGGIANVVILSLLAIVAVFGAAAMFVGSILIGLFALADVSPEVILYVWDGLILAFLFSWAIGPAGRTAAVRRSVAGQVLAFARIAHRRVPDQLPQLARQHDADSLPAGHGRIESRSADRPWAGDDLAVSAAGRLSSDDDRRHAPVSRLAGVAHGQQAPPPHRGCRIDPGLHPALPVAQPAERLSTLGPGKLGPRRSAEQRTAGVGAP